MYHLRYPLCTYMCTRASFCFICVWNAKSSENWRKTLRIVYAVLISNDALWWCDVIFNFVNAYYVSRNPRRLSASRKSSSYSIWTMAMLVQLQLFKKDSYQWNVCILEMLLTSRIWWASGFDTRHGDRLGTRDYHVMTWACLPLLNMK